MDGGYLKLSLKIEMVFIITAFILKCCVVLVLNKGAAVNAKENTAVEAHGPCINTLEDIIFAFHVSLKTPQKERTQNLLMDANIWLVKKQPLIIFRFSDGEILVESNKSDSEKFNATNACCHPDQDSCHVVAVLRKGFLSLLPPSLLYILGVPQIVFLIGRSHPGNEGQYCWNIPNMFCPNAKKKDIVEGFSAQVCSIFICYPCGVCCPTHSNHLQSIKK